MRRPDAALRLAGAAACLALAAISVTEYRRDEAVREAARSCAVRFTLDLRRPSDFATIALAPAGDLAAGVVANAAARDAAEPVTLSGLAPAMRRAWLDSFEALDEELLAARELMLDAIACRPGWAYHPFLLSVLTYHADVRRGASPLDPARWEGPLRLAGRGAPGEDAVWAFWAGTTLDTWPPASQEAGARIRDVLARAFRDPTFVSQELVAAGAALGREEALALVPPRTAPLRAALAALSRVGDPAGAAAALARLEGAERDARAADLLDLAARARRGDAAGLRAACEAWESAHPAREADDERGRAEALRVLSLWPADDAGDWWTDPRGKLIRFLLNGRADEAAGPVLARAAAPLAGIPDSVTARLLLAGGDEEGARAAASASPTAGSLEWTRYLTELGHHELARKRTAEARAALQRILPAAREECEVLLLRRRLARAEGDGAEAERVFARLAALLPRTLPPEVWSASGSCSLCLDPEAPASSLTVEVSAARPALVEYGWDDGRAGTLLVDPPSSRVTLPLRGRGGRHAFAVRPVVGGPVLLSGALLPAEGP